MQKMLTTMGFLVLSLTVFGQAQESVIPSSNNAAAPIPAAKIDLPYAPQVVTEVIKHYARAKGGRSQPKAVGYKLSEHTQLVRNNLNEADLHYYVLLKNNDNPNETELYLKLKSFTRDAKNKEKEYYFNMEEAIDYLNNLKMGVANDASVLQRRLQNKALAKCKKKCDALEKEVNRLARQQQRVKLQVQETNATQKKSRHAEKLNMLDQAVAYNTRVWTNQKEETEKQANALALPVSSNKK